MIKAIAIDEDPGALNLISDFCSRQYQIHLVGTFSNIIEANRFLQNVPADLIFLHVGKPDFLAKQVNLMFAAGVTIVVTSANSDCAIEAFDANAIDFLLKPFTYPRFLQSLAKIEIYMEGLKQGNSSNPDYLLLRVDNALQDIKLEDIVYIEGLDDYAKFHLLSGKTVTSRITIKALTERLPTRQFARIHHSFIVSIDKIQIVRNRTVHIHKQRIPISSSYEQAFLTFLSAPPGDK